MTSTFITGRPNLEFQLPTARQVYLKIGQKTYFLLFHTFQVSASVSRIHIRSLGVSQGLERRTAGCALQYVLRMLGTHSMMAG